MTSSSSYRWAPRWLARSALGAVMLLGTMTTGLSAAHAEAPLQQGWWSATAIDAPVLQVPPAPDVPADGLLVEGGADGPSAFAALLYELPLGSAAGQLLLDVAASSASTPGAVLRLCPLEAPDFAPRQGGPMSAAPTYDCERGVELVPSTDGTAYNGDVNGFVRKGALALAIVPTRPGDRVVFQQPSASSLQVMPGPSPTPTPTPGTGTEGVVPPAGPPSSGSSLADGLALGGPDLLLPLPPGVGETAPSQPDVAPSVADVPTAADQPGEPAVPVVQAADASGVDPRRTAVVALAAAVAACAWAAAGAGAARRVATTEGELEPI